MRNCSSLLIICGSVSACKLAKPNKAGKLVAKPVHSADNHYEEAVAGYAAAEYPEDEIMQALEGIPS